MAVHDPFEMRGVGRSLLRPEVVAQYRSTRLPRPAPTGAGAAASAFGRGQRAAGGPDRPERPPRPRLAGRRRPFAGLLGDFSIRIDR